MSRSLGLLALLRNGKPPSGFRLGTRLFSNAADAPPVRPPKSRFLKPRQTAEAHRPAEELSQSLPSDSPSRLEVEAPPVQNPVPASPAAPPPPPPPGLTAGPKSAAAVPSAAPSAAARLAVPARAQSPAPATLSAEEQYARLKSWLPETKEPDTARPAPDQLKVGTQLRVEWSNGWWRASVKQEGEDKVKVAFDTWSSKYDEWIPRDSQRLRMPLPDDQHAVVASQEAEAQPAEEEKPVGGKPYDPEQEFEKRQRRLKAKIAQSREYVHGAQESEAVSAKGPAAQARAPMADLTKVHEARQMKLRAKIAGLQQERLGQVDTAVSSKLGQASSPASEGKSPQADLPPSPTLQPPPPSAPPPPVAPPVQPHQLPTTPPPEQTTVAQPEPSGSPTPMQEPTPTAADVQTSPEQLPPMPPLHKQDIPEGVRWMELQTDSKEYYYYEVSSGRTQWDLPSLGWVQLRDADGSPYYWLPEDNITQWTPPA